MGINWKNVAIGAIVLIAATEVWRRYSKSSASSASE